MAISCAAKRAAVKSARSVANSFGAGVKFRVLEFAH
jgi:hypothetical protein